MLNEIMDILQDIKQQMCSDFNEMKQCYMDMNASVQRSIDTIDDSFMHLNKKYHSNI